MPRVEIYTTFMCGYCARAIALLKRKGVDFEEIDVTMGGPKKAEMIERSGGRTSKPQVFIGGVHVGGSDDLAAAEASGELDRLLAA